MHVDGWFETKDEAVQWFDGCRQEHVWLRYENWMLSRRQGGRWCIVVRGGRLPYCVCGEKSHASE